MLATSIAIAAGLLTLLGYFLPLLSGIRVSLLALASLLAAVAVWVGVINLFLVHSKKLTRRSPGWAYSIFTLLGLVGVIVVNIAFALLRLDSGPASPANQFIFRYLQTTVGSAIAGLLVFFLVFAGYRVLNRQPSFITFVFVIVVVISLVGFIALPVGLPDLSVLRELRIWIAQVPAVAGARGLLLGIALGVVATGLRVLLALDRPYGD
ncbi:MAG: hypothetical protein ACRDH2_11555 [Anaerolineales bacterium]